MNKRVKIFVPAKEYLDPLEEIANEKLIIIVILNIM